MIIKVVLIIVCIIILGIMIYETVTNWNNGE